MITYVIIGLVVLAVVLWVLLFVGGLVWNVGMAIMAWKIARKLSKGDMK